MWKPKHFKPPRSRASMPKPARYFRRPVDSGNIILNRGAVRAAIVKSGITDSYLSELTGLSYSAIDAAINAKPLSLVDAQQICNAIHIPLGDAMDPSTFIPTWSRCYLGA